MTVYKGRIFHLVTPERWRKALIESHYRPDPLRADRFFHCSTWEQLIESAELHFPNHDELIVLYLLEKRAKKHLVWEKGRNDQLFPHLYGEFPFDAVEATKFLVRNPEGKFELERE
jgi:uncharacterized protein (DUF952 family)